jgi:hypothetical protein
MAAQNSAGFIEAQLAGICNEQRLGYGDNFMK